MSLRKIILGGLFSVIAVGVSGCLSGESFYTNVLRSDVFYQQYESRRYDFLWVMDNSGSMASKRAYVRDNLQRFINILNSRKAVDFQMAVTTTDYFTTAGNLVASPGGQTVVKSAVSSNPVSDMAGIINNVQDSPTSFWEQGLESAYQAIYQHKSSFSRNSVPLTTIFLTDADDYSCMDQCWGVEPENNTNWVVFPLQRYVDFFQNVKSSENTEALVFNIVSTANSNCGMEAPSVRYENLTSTMGGINSSGSLCMDAIQKSFDGIARTLADRGVKFTLTQPAQATGINVYVAGIKVEYSEDNGWIFDTAENAIIFTGNSIPPNGSVVEITYNQQTAN